MTASLNSIPCLHYRQNKNNKINIKNKNTHTEILIERKPKEKRKKCSKAHQSSQTDTYTEIY